MKIKNLVMLAVIFLLSACGSITNKSAVSLIPEKTFSEKESGVVIFSMGATEYCISFATDLILRYLNTTNLVEGMPPMFLDSYVNKSDFPDHHGTVNALRLNPGKYYFSTGILNPYLHTIQTPNMLFEVLPGETTYLGEVFMPTSCASRNSFEIRDNFDRDMAIAVKINPSINQRVPVKRLMRFGTAAAFK